MKKNENLSVYILCGGKSSRMKAEKGLVNFAGRPFIANIIAAVKPITNNVILVTRNEEYRKFGFPLVGDVYEDKGPVGGIYTALTHTRTEMNLILSCDIPLITTEVLQKILSLHENSSYPISIATGLYQRHPLIGIYNKSLKPFFEARVLQNDLKLMDVVQKWAYQTVFIDNLDTLKNINSKEELRSLSKYDLL